MANELALYYDIERAPSAQLYNFAGVGTPVDLTESPAASGRYVGSIPTDLASGTYDVVYFDTGYIVGAERITWDGTAVVTPGSGTIYVTPISATTATNEATSEPLVAYVNETRDFQFGFTDSQGQALNLNGKAIKFIINKLNTSTKLWTITGTVDGSDGSQVAITLADAQTAKEAVYDWAMWNVTDDTVLGTGVLVVKRVPQA